MPRTKPRLTRDKLVAIIGDFYTLTGFYIPSASLKHPPPEGWANITPDATKGFDKSPIVSDVVDYSVFSPEDFANGRGHLGECGLRHWVREMEECKMTSGEENVVEDEKNDSDDDEDDRDGGEEDGDTGDDEDCGGRDIVLDVFKGVIHEDVIRCNLISGVEVSQFFEDLREKYERLEMVPIRGEMFEDVSDVDDSEASHQPRAEGEPGIFDDNDAQQFKKIYRSYGWPGEAYRKEEALAAIEEYRRRRI
ncbi:uncharacterized protein K460DRAFT_402212 [Cucurbitaria berberidis CBS 394.84]|uniref:Uncharacterized protein n=1 Tax=Cucurbitaria berberidis CBS 394.84 TaxID=1168544 RepID=A0A9P4GUV9_9PLEO|nr:uncharacterized protein K460DRAFT_402212 [Cucurbitaria berberidis CBS 394.84]KAF1852225.1 hypothetical protein K460DRAFT_402212 [Cucurbitaria berberidis CBS 394.84]